jgi:hypothetical protein
LLYNALSIGPIDRYCISKAAVAKVAVKSLNSLLIYSYFKDIKVIKIAIVRSC